MISDRLIEALPPDQSAVTYLLRHLGKDGINAVIGEMSDQEAKLLQYEWPLYARPAQRPPDVFRRLGSHTWVIMGGRGMGKTRPGSEQVISWAKELGEGGRIALVAKDPADARKVMIEGESGILACSPPWFRPMWNPSKKEIRWPNGAMASVYSSEEPDDLRGPQHHKAWGDEICKWKHQQETWDMLMFGMRLGYAPQNVLTTTPRPTPTFLSILRDPGTSMTRGTTSDNWANLPQTFLQHIYHKYAGTRLGRQELNAELLEDTPGALWTLDLIEASRVHKAPPLVKLVIAVDPQAAEPTKDPELVDGLAETGIVAAGKGEDGHLYILHDLSGSFSPNAWGKKVVAHYESLRADRIIAEINNGGAMVEHVVKVAAQHANREPAFKAVHASRGKHTRAEPVAALYEQGRAHHVGMFPDLEDQMSTWVPGNKSPDRMDAMVWAATELMLLSPNEMFFT